MTYSYEAKVDRVVDGDTLDLCLDLGFRISNRDRFRLEGIDTPERGQTGWMEAKTALSGKLAGARGIRVVTSHPTTRDPKDKYGRWLATIYVGERNINQEMIAEGFAVEYAR